VTVISLDSGEVITFSKSECDFMYRDSLFRRASLIVISAELLLSPSNRETIHKTISTLLQKRVDSQPLDKPNAGSIFKNPNGNSAGKLIDFAGLKGVNVGQAQISPKHANFIVNLGGATAKDVLSLIKKIQMDVMAKYGVTLTLELVVLSDSNEA
jgi:UDP-N-acetylmuramate dehydrogenase